MKLIKIYQFKRNGFVYYSIDYVANDNPGSVELSVLDWNRSEIVNSLIRTRYSQDRVEAITWSPASLMIPPRTTFARPVAEITPEIIPAMPHAAAIAIAP